MDMYFPTPRPVTMPASTVELLDGDLPAAAATGQIHLLDTEMRTQAGITVPVYMTAAAWDRHVAVTPAAAKMGCDEKGRLWDVLMMYVFAVKTAVHNERFGPCLRFTFYGVTTPQYAHLCTLIAHAVPWCGEMVTVFTTTEEALGEAIGEAINRYGRLFGEGDDEETDDF